MLSLTKDTDKFNEGIYVNVSAVCIKGVEIQALQTRYNLLSQLYRMYLYASITSIYTLQNISIIAIHSKYICVPQLVFYGHIRRLYQIEVQLVFIVFTKYYNTRKQQRLNLQIIRIIERQTDGQLDILFFHLESEIKK